MGFELCSNCKEYHWEDKPCAPKFRVYYEEYMGDDYKIVHAWGGFEGAAEKFAEYYNTHCDYALMNETIEIEVEQDGVRKKFKVGAEPSIDYTTEEIE